MPLHDYREGLWEIRGTQIIATFPQGLWILNPPDLEYLQIRQGMESGFPFTDVIIKTRIMAQTYPVGRYAGGAYSFASALSTKENESALSLCPS